jgi:hypothetical protein
VLVGSYPPCTQTSAAATGIFEGGVGNPTRRQIEVRDKMTTVHQFYARTTQCTVDGATLTIFNDPRDHRATNVTKGVKDTIKEIIKNKDGWFLHTHNVGKTLVVRFDFMKVIWK